ncbi:MAG: hypothetical protein ACE5KU_03795 [Nitrososphaerales archaeon]
MLEQEAEVIRCIDMVLERLGSGVRRVLILHMRRERGIKRHEILQKPSEFINALRSVLGRSSIAIEREILETIELELNLKRKRNQDLLDLLTDLNERFEQETGDDEGEEDTEKYYTHMDYTKNRKDVY